MQPRLAQCIRPRSLCQQLLGVQRGTLAPSPGGLSGQRVLVLDNGKPGAKLLLESAAMKISERTGSVFVGVGSELRRSSIDTTWSRPSGSHPSPDGDPLTSIIFSDLPVASTVMT